MRKMATKEERRKKESEQQTCGKQAEKKIAQVRQGKKAR
jgi:hypothetical protein